MQKARRHNINAAPTACRHMVSGTISLFCSKFFSPFPHGTGSLSVSREYLALPDGPGRFTQDFTCPALLRILLRFILLRIRDYHPGSKVICTYPQLIAAYHVLHRLREPRHPPCALNYLSFILELSLKKYDCKQTILLKDKVYTFSLYFYFTKSFFFGLFIMSKIDST